MSNKSKIDNQVDEAAISINISDEVIKKSRFYLITKRAIDIVGSLCGITLLSPIMIIIAIAIKLEDSKGKIIFEHMRVGKDGKIFPCLKFRSMFSNAEEMKKNFTEEQKREYAKNFKLKDDPRITKVGKFIRKTSLDELPQLFNILKGDMTIVGPRPIVTDELDFYDEYEQYYKAVKPGLTGIWQVSGRSDTTYDERVAFDMEYVTTRNTFKDLYIIFMTAVKVLKREGAR